MAVCKMNLVSIIGPVKKLDELVNICGESGVFQPDNVYSFYSSTENFSPITEENPFSAPLAKLKNAIYSCGGKVENADVSGFQVSRSKIDKFVNYFSEKVETLVDKKREIHTNITNLNDEFEKLKHFRGLDKTMDEVLSCEYIKARFGRMPVENFSQFEKISQESKLRGLDLMFFEFDNDDENVWGIYFARVEDLEEIDRIFSKMQFREVKMRMSEKTPVDRSNEIKIQLSILERNLEVIEEEIARFWSEQKAKCMQFYKKIEKLSAYFEIKSYAAKYGDSFILVGWVPEYEIKGFKEKIGTIKELKCSVDSGDDLLKNSPPVKLKNNRLFRPFEFFVSTYGMPCYNEIDPTVFVAMTYPLLFGIMFADLGQGLLVALVGWLMFKFKNMKLGKVMIPCGLASAFFGLIFGSVFGFEHALDPVYQKVFGLKEKPIDVMGPSSSNMIIYSAVGIGIVLLIISMIFGICSNVKRKNIGEAIFGPSGICGLTFYSSVIFMLLDSMIFHTGVVSVVYVLGLIILPLILIMFKDVLADLVEGKKDWKPESWVDYVLQSFFELFEVLLSYAANTMSFLRVGAFVLVHAGMMMVVFTVAEMVGGVGYIIILVLGNILVAALEALLSGIQVLRLEFYEMFSKFFEGQGRPFSPVVADQYTK